MSQPLLELFAREHPALIHVPLGLVIVLPLAMGISFKTQHQEAWRRTALFIAVLAFAGGFLALSSGLLWGRQIALIAQGSFFPTVASEAQVVQKMLQLHEIAAAIGTGLGGVCVFLIARSRRKGESPGLDAQARRRRFSDRGVGPAALSVSLLWLASWGFCGKLGGIMVFGNEATNQAAAALEASRKNDMEAELPLRALDYASLEPVHPAPARSKSHGNRWGRVWVTASGIDAYRAGKPLPAGAYAVLSTVEDAKGRPGQDPGPLYLRETLENGSSAFQLYWPRVPESGRTETGGEDSVYWRSPSPKLAACAGCHATAGPAAAPAR